jgi:hypothetical protein
VRPADRAAVCLLQDLVDGQRHSEDVQFLDDPFGARVAMRAKLAEPPLKCIKAGEMQRQQVDFVVVLKRTQLASGDDPDTQPVTCCLRRRNSIDCVVIRERERGESATLGSFDYTLGRKDSIRRRGVGVQVDVRRPARIRTHRS